MTGYDFVQVSLAVTTRPLVSVNDVVIVFFVSLTLTKTSGPYEAMSGAFVWITYVKVLCAPVDIGAVATL